MSDVISAHAILATRSIILRHPQQRSSLMPFLWEERFAPALGTYSSFIKSRSPDIFVFEELPTSGLLKVGLSNSFRERDYISYQRIVAGQDLPDLAVVAGAPNDPHYDALVAVDNPMHRAALAGGLDVLEKATGILRAITKDKRNGVPLTIVMKALGEAGIAPLPLEWFNSEVIRLSSTGIFRRKTPPIQSHPLTGPCQKVESMLTESFEQPLQLDAVVHALGMSRRTVLDVIRGCPNALYEPNVIFACTELEKLVYGYLSPHSMAAAVRADELSKMSPTQHLLASIRACLANSPDRSLPTEHVMAWCAALDLKPRVVLQCLRGTIFWSSPHADLEILLRPPGFQHPNPLPEDFIPPELMSEILQAIKDLGEACSVDRLSAVLKWGRGSDNRKRFGPLRALLSRMPAVFFDPYNLYDKTSIEGLVIWPPSSANASDRLETVTKFEQDQANLFALNSSVFYYLTQGGYSSYPLSDLRDAFSRCGLEEEMVQRMSQLFVPGNGIFLRRGWEAANVRTGTLDHAVLHALATSGRKAVDADNLIKVITESQRFQQSDVDSFRETLWESCGDVASPGLSAVGRVCYFNPHVVLLDAVATVYLEVPAHDTKPILPSDFLPKALEHELIPIEGKLS